MKRECSSNFFEVRDLKKSFGKQQVLRGVNLDVKCGESLVLLGTSGGGKSVLLKHLACLMQADEGTLMVEDQDVCGLSERQLGKVRTKIGIMFQGGALFDSLSVGQNVGFPLTEKGKFKPKEIREQVLEILAEVGLEEHIDKMPGDLSGGMRKRVALARAIISEPKCLLYDEPGAGLDPVVADSIDFLIREVQLKKNTTSITITHELKSVFRIADRIAFLRAGEVYWIGTPQEFRDSDDPVLKNFIDGRSGEDWDSLYDSYPSIKPTFKHEY